MQRARAVYTNGSWGVELDTKGKDYIGNRFMKACRKHLKKTNFPTSQWYLEKEEGNILRVACYGPNARADARDAAVILSEASNMVIEELKKHG